MNRKHIDLEEMMRKKTVNGLTSRAGPRSKWFHVVDSTKDGVDVDGKRNRILEQVLWGWPKQL